VESEKLLNGQAVTGVKMVKWASRYFHFHAAVGADIKVVVDRTGGIGDPDYYLNTPSSPSFPDPQRSEVANTDCDSCEIANTRHELIPSLGEKGLYRVTIFGYCCESATVEISLHVTAPGIAAAGKPLDPPRVSAAAEGGRVRLPLSIPAKLWINTAVWWGGMQTSYQSTLADLAQVPLCRLRVVSLMARTVRSPPTPNLLPGGDGEDATAVPKGKAAWLNFEILPPFEGCEDGDSLTQAYNRLRLSFEVARALAHHHIKTEPSSRSQSS
jgi:hypothetical protein